MIGEVKVSSAIINGVQIKFAFRRGKFFSLEQPASITFNQYPTMVRMIALSCHRLSIYLIIHGAPDDNSAAAGSISYAGNCFIVELVGLAATYHDA